MFDECIDCGACIPECPVEAIFADTDVHPRPDIKPTAAQFHSVYAAHAPGVICICARPIIQAAAVTGKVILVIAFTIELNRRATG